MAFAIASGLTPQAGIYCAVVTGFLISALGGSKTQIGGPTGAFVVVVAGIVAVHGVDGLFMCTVMAGVLLIILGVTGMGTAVKFIPRPVVTGFTNGIARSDCEYAAQRFLRIEDRQNSGRVLAADGNDRSQLSYAVLHRDYSRRWHRGDHAGLQSDVESHPWTNRCHARGYGGGGRVQASGRNDRDALWRNSERAASLAIPHFRFDLIHGLLGPAFTVAMLGAIESLMSAVVADRMSNDHHNPNVELMAQGVANIVSPMFGGLPATGAIARTATNIRSGAKTPMAGIIHALTLVCVLMFAAPLARYIPMAALAGILMVVAYNMGEWQEIPQLLKLTKTDISIWLVTFALTVFADLTVAVEAGMILAALLFIGRVANLRLYLRSPTTTSKTAGCTSCKTKTFLTTRPSFVFTGRSCLGRPIKSR